MISPETMLMRTVKVTNVSLGASEHEIKEFFSFSGEIEYIEMQRDNEKAQMVYVTFKDPHGTETALLLSGATIVDQPISITLAETTKLPPASTPSEDANPSDAGSGSGSTRRKAEDVVSTMLAKGFILGIDALTKAKEFDEKHNVTSKVASLDEKMGISEKIIIGTAVVNEKMKEMDEKYQVSEKAKSAYAAAEQTVGTAGSAIMSNRYVLTGASWVTDAFNKVSKVAEEVGQKAMEKMAEEVQVRNEAQSDRNVDDSAPVKATMGEQQGTNVAQGDQSEPTKFTLDDQKGTNVVQVEQQVPDSAPPKAVVGEQEGTNVAQVDHKVTDSASPKAVISEQGINVAQADQKVHDSTPPKAETNVQQGANVAPPKAETSEQSANPSAPPSLLL